MTITKAIARLNKKFPGINAVPSEDFDGSEGGIWFQQEGALHPDGTYYFDYYGLNQVHSELQKTLDSLGLFAEPYDAGTWMAFKH